MYNQPVADRWLVSCLHCDLLQRLPDLAPKASARCPRCNFELWRPRKDSLNRMLALAFAAAILYVIANTVPMLGLTVVGREAFTTVIGGAQHLWITDALRSPPWCSSPPCSPRRSKSDSFWRS